MTTIARRLASLPLAFLVVTVALAAPMAVRAHAELLETSPAEGTTVEGTPTEVSAIFSEGLEPESSLELRDAAEATVAEGGLDPEDPTRLVIADVLDLAPGVYEARWTSATDDGHIERGTWTFTVAPAPTPSPTPSPSPTPAPSATASPTPTPAPSPSEAPSPSGSPAPSGGDSPAGNDSDVVLPIILGLAIVAGVGGFLLLRRRPTPPPT
jgi:copper resistance protein C